MERAHSEEQERPRVALALGIVALAAMMMRGVALVTALAAASNSVVTGLSLFDDDANIEIVDKAGVYNDVFGVDQPILLGAFSDDATECQGCGPVSDQLT